MLRSEYFSFGSGFCIVLLIICIELFLRNKEMVVRPNALVKKKETEVSISGGLPGFLERRVLSLEVLELISIVAGHC
ncbi:hypothetical protein L6452_26339 [Arctium lappa]|uniref:Uncharacterized protein n=1 Tax=Arctium lappa TaxID=4217 RepID=A0ACB9AGZ9_ARCLA|nr:hypothetical protein L6452_26339 [Arctium lappa]